MIALTVRPAPSSVFRISLAVPLSSPVSTRMASEPSLMTPMFTASGM